MSGHGLGPTCIIVDFSGTLPKLENSAQAKLSQASTTQLTMERKLCYVIHVPGLYLEYLLSSNVN